MADLAIDITPTSPTSVLDSCRIDLSGLDSTTESYVYFDPEATTGSPGTSVVFSGSEDGNYTVLSHIFDAAGTWTIRLRKLSDDSDIATQSLTVA